MGGGRSGSGSVGWGGVAGGVGRGEEGGAGWADSAPDRVGSGGAEGAAEGWAEPETECCEAPARVWISRAGVGLDVGARLGQGRRRVQPTGALRTVGAPRRKPPFDGIRYGWGRPVRARPHVAHFVGELVYEDAVPERGVTHVGAGTAVDVQAVAPFPHDLDRALSGAGLLGEDCGEAGGVRGADDDPRAQPGAGEVRRRLVGDDPAAVQRDDPVRDTCGLLGVGGADQDGAAVHGVGAQHAVQPAALPGGEPYGGVIEHEGVRVGEQRAGQPEAAVHATGEGAEVVPRAG
ncbi:hypothetical protein SGLAM104S_01020 [Streptomyces glaucescens]